MKTAVGRWARVGTRWARAQPVLPRGRFARVGAILLLVLVAIGSGTAVTLDRIHAVPAGAAFRVGDEVVSVRQLDDRVKLLGALYGVTPPRDPALLDKFHRDTAKAIVVSDVLDNAARERGIVIADKTANDQLLNVIDKSFSRGRAAFDQNLASIGLGSGQVVDEIKRQLADAQLYAQVTKDVPAPTDQDVAQSYQQRKAEMVAPEQRHLRNIVVKDQDQAKQVAAQLAGGADFAVVAAASSLDDSTGAKGGDLGTVTRDQLEKAYGDAAFGTAPTAAFGPVQTQYGWNVGQVLQVTPAVPLSLEQVRDNLRAMLFNQRKETAWESWLGGQLKASDVRYADGYRPTDPDTAAPPPVPAN